MLLLLSSLAVADDRPPELAFDTTAAVASAGKTFEQGPARVQFGDGVLVPIRVGNASGVAFSGTATLSATFADRGDAQHLANQQVLRLSQPTAEWTGVAHGAPLELVVSRAIILGDAASVAPLLTGATTVAAGFRADAVQRRFETLDEALRIEFNTREGADASGFLVADFFGDRPLGYVRPIPVGNADEDRYLTVVHKPTEHAYGDDLAAIGKIGGDDIHYETVALGAWTEPKTRTVGGHLQWNGIEPMKVTAKVLARPTGAGFTIAVTGEATFHFRAVRDLKSVRVEDPASGHRKPWVVTKLQIDGADVPVPAEPDDGFDLPISTKRGGEADIHIEWTDSWSFASMTPEGRSIWPQYPLPSVATQAWPFELKFGTYDADKMASACSGLTVDQSSEGGVAWVTSTSTTHYDWPRCSIGAWRTYAEPPRDDFPAFRVAMFGEESNAAASLPSFARTVVAFYEGLLPPLPTEEVEIIQVPDQYFGFVWTSTLGIVTLQQAKTYGFESAWRATVPHLEEGTMSHEIAHQWWGALVDNARDEDRWFVESLAETYACVFLAAAYGPKTCATREDEWQKEIEAKATPRVSWSLTRARSTGWFRIVYDYGPYILKHTLRGRIGDQAFFGALDGWARDRTNTPATAAGLQAAFEATSGQDLTAFFDQWVDDGFIPGFSGEWSAHSVTVYSDIPFGTIEVPVAVIHADGSTETLWLSVTDGVGALQFATAATRVVLDPNELIPARTRKLVAAK